MTATPVFRVQGSFCKWPPCSTRSCRPSRNRRSRRGLVQVHRRSSCFAAGPVHVGFHRPEHRHRRWPPAGTDVVHHRSNGRSWHGLGQPAVSSHVKFPPRGEHHAYAPTFARHDCRLPRCCWRGDLPAASSSRRARRHCYHDRDGQRRPVPSSRRAVGVCGPDGPNRWLPPFASWRFYRGSWSNRRRGSEPAHARGRARGVHVDVRHGRRQPAAAVYDAGDGRRHVDLPDDVRHEHDHVRSDRVRGLRLQFLCRGERAVPCGQGRRDLRRERRGSGPDDADQRGVRHGRSRLRHPGAEAPGEHLRDVLDRRPAQGKRHCRQGHDVLVPHERVEGEFAQRRVAIGKGQRGKHWKIAVSNYEGEYFSFSSLDAVFAQTARRI